jgi:hypothetical protein
VPLSVKIQDIDGKPELIKGRADWVLGYGKDKINTGSFLIVIEAKPHGNASIGLPQMLVTWVPSFATIIHFSALSIFSERALWFSD